SAVVSSSSDSNSLRDGKRHPYLPPIFASRHVWSAVRKSIVVALGTRCHTTPVSWSSTAWFDITHANRCELQPPLEPSVFPHEGASSSIVRIVQPPGARGSRGSWA